MNFIYQVFSKMPLVVTVVDDYIESLLRDACIRIELYPARTKALEWGQLLSAEECTNNVNIVQNVKKAIYVVHHLLNVKKLTDSFSKYFEKRTQMTFNGNNVAFTDEKGSVTLIELFNNKISRFKKNFNHYVRGKCQLSISKGENESGGRGKQLKNARTHSEVLERRRQKRKMKTAQKGRNFYLNYYLSNGEKYIKVRCKIFIHGYKNSI